MFYLQTSSRIRFRRKCIGILLKMLNEREEKSILIIGAYLINCSDAARNVNCGVIELWDTVVAHDKMHLKLY